jgi:hypothetical protein
MPTQIKYVVLERLEHGFKRIQLPDGKITVIGPNFPYEPLPPLPPGVTGLEKWERTSTKNVGSGITANVLECAEHPGVLRYYLHNPEGFKPIGNRVRTITEEQYVTIVNSVVERKLRRQKAKQDELVKEQARQVRLAAKKARHKKL